MSDRSEAIARLEAALANALRRERAFGGDGSVIVDIPDLCTLLAELASQAERIKVVEGALRELLGHCEIAAVMPEATGKAYVMSMDSEPLDRARNALAARALGEPSDEPGSAR